MGNLEIRQSMQQVVNFLARRDIDDLTESSLQAVGLSKIDVLILLGNAIPYTVKVAAKAYHQNLVKKILVSGGCGHSTSFLYKALQNRDDIFPDGLEGKAEAEIFRDLLIKEEGVDPAAILLEAKSLNCGDNAKKTIEVLLEKNICCQSLLLLQDPLMQQRSHASFRRYFDEKNVKIISYAPFCTNVTKEMAPANDMVDGLWSKERFWELLSGEIPRLLDKKDGYGPAGKDYIAHVDIPMGILQDYDVVKQYIVRQGMNLR